MLCINLSPKMSRNFRVNFLNLPTCLPIDRRGPNKFSKHDSTVKLPTRRLRDIEVRKIEKLYNTSFHLYEKLFKSFEMSI